MTDESARRLAEEWLTLLAETLPRSSWLSLIRALLEAFPRAFVEAGGTFDELSKMDLRDLTSFVPQLGILVLQHQNAATPIFRLPQEIMERIFLSLRDLSRPAWKDKDSQSMDWLRACTHVCQKWRSVSPSWLSMLRQTVMTIAGRCTVVGVVDFSRCQQRIAWDPHDHDYPSSRSSLSYVHEPAQRRFRGGPFATSRRASRRPSPTRNRLHGASN